MNLVELGLLVHGLRYARTGRAVGYRMSLNEVRTAALDCKINNVGSIYIEEVDDLADSFDGTFARFDHPTEPSIVNVSVRGTLPSHWLEFACVKELMHCWSSRATYVGTPSAGVQLIEELTKKRLPYTSVAGSDIAAIVAAAEVMLPLKSLMKTYSHKHDHVEVAHRHNLHADVAEFFCRTEMIHLRSALSL